MGLLFMIEMIVIVGTVISVMLMAVVFFAPAVAVRVAVIMAMLMVVGMLVFMPVLLAVVIMNVVMFMFVFKGGMFMPVLMIPFHRFFFPSSSSDPTLRVKDHPYAIKKQDRREIGHV